MEDKAPITAFNAQRRIAEHKIDILLAVEGVTQAVGFYPTNNSDADGIVESGGTTEPTYQHQLLSDMGDELIDHVTSPADDVNWETYTGGVTTALRFAVLATMHSQLLADPRVREALSLPRGVAGDKLNDWRAYTLLLTKLGAIHEILTRRVSKILGLVEERMKDLSSGVVNYEAVCGKMRGWDVALDHMAMFHQAARSLLLVGIGDMRSEVVEKVDSLRRRIATTLEMLLSIDSVTIRLDYTVVERVRTGSKTFVNRFGTLSEEVRQLIGSTVATVSTADSVAEGNGEHPMVDAASGLARDARSFLVRTVFDTAKGCGTE